MIIAVNFPISAIGRKKPEKYQGYNGIQTRDLRNTCAMLNPTNWPCSQWAQQIDLAPNVWLHSSVGPASHGIAELMGSNPIEALIFFRPLPSNCLNWKKSLLRRSLFTFIYNCSTNMDFIYISHCLHIVINSKRTMFKNCKKQPLGDCAKDPRRWYNS